MGCGDTREKLEDEMIKLKFQRAQIQMERKNQIKILEGLEQKKITEPIIPDFVSLKPEKPIKKLLTDTNNKLLFNNKNENKNNKSPDKKNNKSPDNKNKSKNVKTKKKKLDNTEPESKKDGKSKKAKKAK